MQRGNTLIQSIVSKGAGLCKVAVTSLTAL